MSKSVMYQTSTIRALLEGIYDGDQSIAELKARGDFGLGTFDGVDGELIAVDGHFYCADEQGVIAEADPHCKTPFATVTTFKAESEIALEAVSMSELEALICAQFSSINYMYAIRIEAEFDSIDLRSEACQPKPYRPLAETLPKLQNSFERRHLSGVLVGLWFPEYMAALNVPGFHFHFVDANKQVGGHVFGLKLKQGKASIQRIEDFAMHLPNTPAFGAVDLNHHDPDACAAVETARKI